MSQGSPPRMKITRLTLPIFEFGVYSRGYLLSPL